MSQTRTNPGHFQPGHDPRRHQFTREECRKGYQSAEASIERRYPGADGHFLMCALIGSKPQRNFYPTPGEIAGMTDAELLTKYATF